MPAEHHFSWLHEIAIPVLFTLFGAGLGFITGELRDGRKAKRDKKAFLRAVGMELDALGNQLSEWNRTVKDSLQRVRGGSPTGPQLGAVLQTTVFTTQLSKLRDVNDSLLAEVILFYSELGVVEQSIKFVNDISVEFSRADSFQKAKEEVRPRLISTLRVTEEQISATGEKLLRLRAKLPAVGH
jgi:hypothetical protein